MAKITKNMFVFGVFLVFAILFFSVNVDAIRYTSSTGFFDAYVVSSGVQENSDYGVHLMIDNDFGGEQEFDIEIIYAQDSLVVSEKEVSCEKSCSVYVPLKKVFFDDYSILITAKNKNTYYKKELEFSLEQPKAVYDVHLKDKYYIKNGTLNVNGFIDTDSYDPEFYYFEISPKTSPESISVFDVTCIGSCQFSFVVDREILLDTYEVRVYSESGDLFKEFEAIFYDGTQIDSNDFADYESSFDFEDMFFEIIKENRIRNDGGVFDFESYFQKRSNLNKVPEGIENYYFFSRKFCEDSEFEIEDVGKCEFGNLYISKRVEDIRTVSFKEVPRSIVIGEEFEFEIEVIDEDFLNYIILPKGFEFVDDKKNKFEDKKEEHNRNEKRNIKLRGIIYDANENIVIRDIFGFENKFDLNVLKSVEVSDYENNLGVEIKGFSKSKSKLNVVNVTVAKENVRLKFDDLDVRSFSKMEVLDSGISSDEGSGILTPILNVEALNFSKTAIILSKSSDLRIGSILTCSDFVNGSCVTFWQDSGFGFEQNDTHVWFEVTHFSAYMGVGPGYVFNDDFDDYSDLLIEKNSADTVLLNVSCDNTGNCGAIDVSLGRNFIYDYLEDLEVGFGNWTADGGSCTWVRDQGGTPSANTGPTIDNTLGTATGWYAYVEASGNACQGADTQAVLTSSVFSAGVETTNVSFWYHMIGTALGTLHLDVFDGSSWINDVWSVTGAQQATQTDPYLQAAVDLSSYSGDIQVRIRYDGVTGWSADAAIDDLRIYANGKQILNSSSSPLWIMGDAMLSVNLNQGQSQLVSFNVNATGNVGDTIPIFSMAKAQSDYTIASKSNDKHIIIADLQPPSGSKNSPINGSSFTVNNMSFSASANDNFGLDSAKLWVWNLDGSFYDSKILDLGGAISSLFNMDYNFSMAGDYMWNIEVNDTFGNSVFLGSNWTLTVIFPYLTLEYVNGFSDPFYVDGTQNGQIFVNISCHIGNCGSVDVSLLSEQLVTTYNYFEDFETGTLGSWTNTAIGDQQDWTLDQGGTPSAGTGPSVDHTLGSATGWYTYFETSNPVANGDQAYLVSPVFSSSGTVVFDFWYHMLGPDLGTLQVEFLNGSVWSTLWSISGDQGDVWYNRVVSFDYNGNTQLRFIGERGTNWGSDIAVDDLNISVVEYQFLDFPTTSSIPFWSNSSIPQTINLNVNESIVVSFNVNATGSLYESIRSYASSDINSGLGSGAAGSVFNFTISDLQVPSGVKISPVNGSSFNFNNLSFSTSATDNMGLDSAKLWIWTSEGVYYDSVVMDLQGNISSIFSIDYNFSMAGDYLWNIEINDTFGNDVFLGNNWSLTVIFPYLTIDYVGNVSSPFYINQYNFRPLQVNVSCHVGNCGLVNVTLLYEELTQTYVYFEDFETGTLGSWTNTAIGDQQDWTLNQGPTGSAGTGPSVDHTLGSATGWYTYFETSNPVANGDQAYFLSPIFSSSGTVNFYFWYHMFGPDLGSIYVDFNDGSSWYNLWNLSLDQGDIWYNNSFNFDFSGNGQFRIVGERGTNWGSDIAVDDLNISVWENIFYVMNNSADSPFWTNTTNSNTVNLNINESVVVTFYINATGNVLDSFSAFVSSDINSGLGSGVDTSQINLTIAEVVPPTGYKIFPISGTFFSTSQVNFVANVSDNNELGFAKLYVWDENMNLDGTKTIDLSGLSTSLLNFTYNFRKNGNYSWNVYVEDMVENSYWLDNGVNWSVDVVFPNIVVDFLGSEPTIDVYQNQLVNVSFNVSCEGGDCGLVNVSFYLYDYISYFEDLELGFGQWSIDGGSCDWIRDQGGTPSTGTGPTIDNTLKTAFGWYGYVEASGNACQGADTSAILTGPTFSNDKENAGFDFWYHMFGTNVGTLHLDVFDGSSWVNDVWSRTGQQQTLQTDPYLNTYINLSSYIGDIATRIRYDGVTGWSADAAVDDLNLTYFGRVLVNDSSTVPMWVTNTNLRQVSLNNGESTVVTFTVNGTGEIDSEYLVAGYAVSNLNPNVNGLSLDKTLRILEELFESRKLRFDRSIVKFGEGLFGVSLSLRNLGEYQSPINSGLFVYAFVSDEFNLSSGFTFSTSSRYSTLNESIDLVDVGGVNGTLHQFNISSLILDEGVLLNYSGEWNSSNMWDVNFNLSSLGEFDYNNMILTGFDPLERKK